MKKLMLLFALLVMPSLYAISGSIYNPIAESVPYIHKLSGKTVYPGDEQGLFAGNSVAVLDDGSSWKVHPDHTDLFSSWDSGDVVYIDVRTTWYWFKREHKFILQNDTRNEWVYVMLVDSPLKLTYVGDSVHTVIIYGQYGTSYGDYRRNITLSDGSKWDIDSDSVNNLKLQSCAYVGFKRKKNEEAALLIIYGKGKDTYWQWGRKGHYRYL